MSPQCSRTYLPCVIRAMAIVAPHIKDPPRLVINFVPGRSSRRPQFTIAAPYKVSAFRAPNVRLLAG
jgi:hypothetical protein